jgi:hypothetical protein
MTAGRLFLLLAMAWPAAALAEPAGPGEVMAALRTFYPGVTDDGISPLPANADLSGAIAKGLDGDWYRIDILGTVEPELVATACTRGPVHISTAANEITLVQGSKSGDVTYRYTYVGGSLYSEWVDMPALFARLGLDKITDEEKRRQLELNVLRNNGGFVVMVRASENVLWMYSLAGGPRLYARCG